MSQSRLLEHTIRTIGLTATVRSAAKSGRNRKLRFFRNGLEFLVSSISAKVPLPSSVNPNNNMHPVIVDSGPLIVVATSFRGNNYL
jgi:hypothetical protein